MEDKNTLVPMDGEWDIRPFNVRLVSPATHFANVVREESDTFNHFQHTMPVDMLGEDWNIWCVVRIMGVYREIIDGRPVLVDTYPYIIGWGQVQNFKKDERKAHICRIGFALLESERGKGIGSQLVSFILGRTLKYRKVEATVYEDNGAMLHIYDKYGFIVEGVFSEEENWNGVYRNIYSLAKFNDLGV